MYLLYEVKLWDTEQVHTHTHIMFNMVSKQWFVILGIKGQVCAVTAEEL